MNINQKLTETDINNIDGKSQLGRQIQIQQTNVWGWIIDKIISMRMRFHKTGEINGLKQIEVASRSNAILNKETKDEYCFSWSFLACLHPFENDHPSRVGNYRQYFN